MKTPAKTPAIFQRAVFLSPKDLLQRSCAITVIFLCLHLAGLREFTSILNGTVGSLALGWKLSAFLAVVYILSYLAVVVLVPIMLLASIILLAWQRGFADKPKSKISNEPPLASSKPD
jgi:hypothetical protein